MPDQGFQILAHPLRLLGQRYVLRVFHDVFDFELTAEQMSALGALDTGVRGGPDPDSITLEAFGREIPEA